MPGARCSVPGARCLRLCLVLVMSSDIKVVTVLCAQCPVLGARCLAPGARCSVPEARCSVLGARCSVPGVPVSCSSTGQGSSAAATEPINCPECSWLALIGRHKTRSWDKIKTQVGLTQQG